MKAIRHTGITVTNLKKAMGFYGDLLGFKSVRKMEECGDFIEKISGLKKGAKVTTVKMAADDGSLIELLYYHSRPTPHAKNKRINTIGLSHIAFTVEDIDAEYIRLSKVGVKFNSVPQVSPDNYAKVAICRDFDGNLIELVEVLGEK